jgi:UDP-galactopyranose mutase
LSAAIIDRLPVFFDQRRDYFKNYRWQGIPLEGYARMFGNLLSSENIEVILNCDYFKDRHSFRVKKKVIYTGRIDQFFDYRHGVLEWRAIDLERRVVAVEDFQGIAVMNYAEASVPHTRILEPRHFHPERKYTKERTVIFHETSRFGKEDECYYPVNTPDNIEILERYRALAMEQDAVIFGGRMGDYAYYDMDSTILSVLDCYRSKVSCGLGVV